MEITQGNIGPETKYDIAIVGGELKLSVSYVGKDGHGDVNLYLSPAAILDAFKGKNAIADTLISLAESVIPKG